MDTNVIVTVAGIVASAAAAFFASRFAGRASVAAARVPVEAEAFSRAQTIYERTLAENEAQRLRYEVRQQALEARCSTLEHDVTRIRTVVREHARVCPFPTNLLDI